MRLALPWPLSEASQHAHMRTHARAHAHVPRPAACAFHPVSCGPAHPRPKENTAPKSNRVFSATLALPSSCVACACDPDRYKREREGLVDTGLGVKAAAKVASAAAGTKPRAKKPRGGASGEDNGGGGLAEHVDVYGAEHLLRMFGACPLPLGCR